MRASERSRWRANERGDWKHLEPMGGQRCKEAEEPAVKTCNCFFRKRATASAPLPVHWRPPRPPLPSGPPTDQSEFRWNGSWHGQENAVGTSSAADTEMRQMSQPRGRLLSQRSQETLPLEGMYLHQLPPGGRTPKSHGSPGRPQKVICNWLLLIQWVTATLFLRIFAFLPVANNSFGCRTHSRSFKVTLVSEKFACCPLE